jgi:hypothetical protein
MPQERQGAAHRITATRTQDPTSHHQVTRAPTGPPANRAVWSGQDWVDRTSGAAFNADEVEQLGLDPSLRTM